MAGSAVTAGPAFGQADTTPPTLNVGTLSPLGPAQYGTGTAGQTPVFGTGVGTWFVNTTSGPFPGVTLNMTATDNVAVAQLQYSLNAGVTYINVPITPGPSVSGSAVITQEGNTSVRYRAIDSAGNISAFRTISVPIDTVDPVVSYPTGLPNGVNSNRVGHSAYVTPTRTDPTPSSGQPAIREAELDGEAVTPQTLDASKLSLGRHTWAVTAGDGAGNGTKATLTFLVVATYADLQALVTRYTTPDATTLASAAVAGATSVRLANVRGRVSGDTLTIGTGASQETAVIDYIPVPTPTGTAVNAVLTAPLANAHAAGEPVAMTSATPPDLPAPLAASLQAHLTAASAASTADDSATAIDELKAFRNAVQSQVPHGAIRDLLVGDANDLIDQESGKPGPSEDGLGLVSEPANGANQHPLVTAPDVLPGVTATRMLPSASQVGYDPDARFKVLVMSNRSDGFRHESIQTYERMIQQLGVDHNFDVDLFDYVFPNQSVANPFISAAFLSKYAVIVGVSSVGNNQFVTARTLSAADAAAHGLPPGTIVNEQAAFQGYIRNGGAFVGLHGASDSMHNWDWYKELIAGEFQNHGNNTGAMQPQCPSCNVTEVVVEDPTHPSTAHLPAEFLHRDELYNFRSPPRAKAHPLLTLTDASFSTGFNDGVAPGFTDSQSAIGGTPGTNTFNAIPGYGSDHPISWCQNFEGGKVWANILTHNWEPAYDPKFQLNILKGIEWAADEIEGNCVTYREVTSYLNEQETAGGITAAAASAGRALVDSAYGKYLDKNYNAAVTDINGLQALALKPKSGNAAARAELLDKARELRDWMNVLS